MPDVWEVERDRLGLMFSGPLEVGECRRVVAAEDYERLLSLIRGLRGTLTTQTGLAGRIEAEQLVEYERRVRLIGDALDALTDPPEGGS